MLSAVLTTLYAFRLLFVVFFEEAGKATERSPKPIRRWMIRILYPLAVLSVFDGFLNLPGNWTGKEYLARYLSHGPGGRAASAGVCWRGVGHANWVWPGHVVGHHLCLVSLRTAKPIGRSLPCGAAGRGAQPVFQWVLFGSIVFTSSSCNHFGNWPECSGRRWTKAGWIIPWNALPGPSRRWQG